MGDETPKPPELSKEEQARIADIEARVQRSIDQAINYDSGSLKGHINEIDLAIRTQITNDFNNAKRRGVLSQTELKDLANEKGEMDGDKLNTLVRTKLNEAVNGKRMPNGQMDINGTLKKDIMDSELGIPPGKGGSQLQQSLIEGAQMANQIQKTQSAFANFNILNPLSWFALPLAIISLITENDYVKAGIQHFFGGKDEHSPKTYAETLAKVKSEKRYIELAQSRKGIDGRALFAEMNRPIEPPANDNTASAAVAADEGKFNAVNGELPPPPAPTPKGNTALASATKGPGK